MGGYEFYYRLNDFHILKASMLSKHNYKNPTNNISLYKIKYNIMTLEYFYF
ncbi:hypothetical protein ECDEC6D_2370 [Escherichia coli DEC6D]|nr:hypothetical protein ECDEC6D_2370 [Escherichia coli DEC6D]